MRRWFDRIHPLFFATSPILFLLSNNSQTFTPGVLTNPLFWSLFTTFGLALAAVGLMRNVDKGLCLVSLFCFLFFQYGHVVLLLEDWNRKWHLVSWAWLTLILLLPAWFAVHFWRRPLAQPIPRFLSLVGILLVLLPAIRIVTYEAAAANARSPLGVRASGLDPSQLPEPEELPDIYFIVLDGYARADVLLDLYGIDTSAFLHYLQSRGFHVADRSVANYAQTGLSLTSTLNMDYVHELLPKLKPEAVRSTFRRLMEGCRLFTLLRSFGYQIVSLETETDLTRIETADVFLKSGALSEFDSGVLSLTPIAPVLNTLNAKNRSGLDPFEKHRTSIIKKIDRLSTLSGLNSPYFVFAHFLAPHPPFVLDNSGSRTKLNRPFSIRERDWWYGYRNGYSQQVRYLINALPPLIDGILENSSKPPVVILQSDHGPASLWVEHWRQTGSWDTNDPRILWERMSILNAVKVPATSTARHDSTTPVNTFRNILREQFGMNLDTLPDRSYFSTYEKPLVLKEIESQP